MAFQVHPRHKGFVAADDHHDQQVGNHDDVDQAQYHQHDSRFIQFARFDRARDRHGVQDMLQGIRIAEHGADQIR
ncbi:hypothetical protein D3C81_2095350 [compost metagenome]